MGRGSQAFLGRSRPTCPSWKRTQSEADRVVRRFFRIEDCPGLRHRRAPRPHQAAGGGRNQLSCIGRSGALSSSSHPNPQLLPRSARDAICACRHKCGGCGASSPTLAASPVSARRRSRVSGRNSATSRGVRWLPSIRASSRHGLSGSMQPDVIHRPRGQEIRAAAASPCQ